MLKVMLRKQYSPLLVRYISITVKLSYCDSSLVKSKPNLKALVENDFSRVVKRTFKKNFVENLFVKNFELDIFEYPQLDTIEEVERLNFYCKTARNLITDKTDTENALCVVDSRKAVADLKQHQLTGFKIARIRNGFGFLSSEFSYMQEALGVDPSLSKTVCENEDFGIQLIDLFGSEAQKEQYLRKLISGEYIAGFAHLEFGSLVPYGEDSLGTSAIFSPDSQSYTISGTKSWVYNAKFANFFIVSTCIKDSNQKASKPTLFIIDSNLPGVEIHEPIETLGMKNLNICDVTFNDVVVPSSAILGNVHEGGQIIKEILCKGKLNIGGQCLAIMKKLVNRSIKHCIHTEHFDKDKYDVDLFRIKVGQMIAKIYIVESITYLLTGRLDWYNDPDVFLESIIVKIFSSEALRYVIRETMGILGNEIFTIDESFNEILKDSHFYTACEDTNDHLRLVLASTGLNYAMNYSGSIVENISRFWDSMNFFKKFGSRVKTELKNKNDFEGHVHQMFFRECRALENDVDGLGDSTSYLINTYGKDVFQKYWELKYLADLAINIYAMTATLARASRAYCLALQFHETDRMSTDAAVRTMHLKNMKAETLIHKLNVLQGFSKVSSSIMKSNKYSELYPVTKNLTVRKQNNELRARQ